MNKRYTDTERCERLIRAYYGRTPETYAEWLKVVVSAYQYGKSIAAIKWRKKLADAPSEGKAVLTPAARACLARMLNCGLDDVTPKAASQFSRSDVYFEGDVGSSTCSNIRDWLAAYGYGWQGKRLPQRRALAHKGDV